MIEHFKTCLRKEVFFANRIDIKTDTINTNPEKVQDGNILVSDV